MLILTACAGGNGLPQFPEYPLTEPFLEEQRLRGIRAEVIREYRQQQRIRLGRLAASQTLSAWQPIQARITEARIVEAKRRKENRMKPYQEASLRLSLAAWELVQERNQRSTQAHLLNQQQYKQRQDKIQARDREDWLPIQSRIHVHDAGKVKRERAAFIEKQRKIGYPGGTRLSDAGGTLHRIP